jgi:ABC-type multidrug transport system fused ATPase/permease subunit
VHVLNSEQEASGFSAHPPIHDTAIKTVDKGIELVSEQDPARNIKKESLAHSPAPSTSSTQFESVQITYQNLSFSVPVKLPKAQGGKEVQKPVLHNCSGVFRAGRFTAVMGSSG